MTRGIQVFVEHPFPLSSRPAEGSMATSAPHTRAFARTRGLSLQRARNARRGEERERPIARADRARARARD